MGVVLDAALVIMIAPPLVLAAGPAAAAMAAVGRRAALGRYLEQARAPSLCLAHVSQRGGCVKESLFVVLDRQPH